MSNESTENNTGRQPRFRWQGFISLLVFAVLLLMVASGAMLYISPRGRVANWSGWNVLGLDKEGWAALHINVAVVFLVVAFLHLCFNWRMFCTYLKKKGVWAVNLKLELAAAVLLAAALTVGSVLLTPPFQTVIAGRNFFKDYWETRSPAAPAPHAEEFTLDRLGQMAGVSGDEIVEALAELGFGEATAQTTLGQVAARRNVSPNRLFELLAERFPQLRQAAANGSLQGGSGHGPGMGRGFGRRGGPGYGMGPGYGRGMQSGHENQPDTPPAASDDR